VRHERGAVVVDERRAHAGDEPGVVEGGCDPGLLSRSRRSSIALTRVMATDNRARPRARRAREHRALIDRDLSVNLARHRSKGARPQQMRQTRMEAAAFLCCEPRSSSPKLCYPRIRRCRLGLGFRGQIAARDRQAGELGNPARGTSSAVGAGDHHVPNVGRERSDERARRRPDAAQVPVCAL